MNPSNCHYLRHSFASRALALGESLPMIGKLLGHSQVETTARYTHLARDSVHESAARIAHSLAAVLLGSDWSPNATYWSGNRVSLARGTHMNAVRRTRISLRKTRSGSFTLNRLRLIVAASGLMTESASGVFRSTHASPHGSRRITCQALPREAAGVRSCRKVLGYLHLLRQADHRLAEIRRRASCGYRVCHSRSEDRVACRQNASECAIAGSHSGP